MLPYMISDEDTGTKGIISSEDDWEEKDYN